jgi:hypothetical protein
MRRRLLKRWHPRVSTVSYLALIATMTVFDYIFLGLLVLSAAVGMWRGLVSEVIALLAWVVALGAAWLYAGEAANCSRI